MNVSPLIIYFGMKPGDQKNINRITDNNSEFFSKKKSVIIK